MNDTSKLRSAFSTILQKNGITDPIEKLEILGIQDEPGLHWSNPGLKKVVVFVHDKYFPYVVKILGVHSKREILIYRFLSNQNDFAIPNLYYDVFKDDEKEYWMVIEECISCEFSTSEAFWEQVGILLGRIHYPYWNKTDDLPEFFKIERSANYINEALKILIGFPLCQDRCHR